MPKKEQIIKVTEFEFNVIPADFDNHTGGIYNEVTGVVATAFKRNFPNERFERAHGDYYIGITDKSRCKRFLFGDVDGHKIRELNGMDRLREPFRLNAVCTEVAEFKGF